MAGWLCLEQQQEEEEEQCGASGEEVLVLHDERKVVITRDREQASFLEEVEEEAPHIVNTLPTTPDS